MAKKDIFADLDPVFHPKTAAIIGASGKPGKIGHLFMTRFVEAGFHELFAVNPGENEIMGVKSYPAVTDIPVPVDLALVLTPPHAALQAVRECAAKRVGTIVITTAGFAETGKKEGQELQREMVRIARAAGSRIIGPNCIGIYCPSSRLPYTLGQGMEPGSVGVVSQSGFFADFLTHRCSSDGINFSKAVSCGNESDLTLADFLEYMGEDPETEVILVYVEGPKDGRRFYNVCKQVSKKKPVIMWKGGMTEAGSRAAVSHTGSLAGSREIWQGVMRQTGVVSVGSFEEVFDCLHAFHLQPLPKGRRVAIASSPGGTAVSTTDVCLELGLEVPDFSDATRKRLCEIMPSVGGSIRNPADLSIAALVNPQIHGQTVEILADDANTDMVLLIAVAGGEPLRDMIVKAAAGMAEKKPLAVAVLAGDSESVGRDIPLLLSAGISVYPDAARAAKALSRMWEYARFKARAAGERQRRTAEGERARSRERALPIIERALQEGRTVLSEHESKEVLKAYNIPVTREREARDERQFRSALEEIGFPCVIKAGGPAVAHKTEQGLVFLDIRDAHEAQAAFSDVKDKLNGRGPTVLVQEMIAGGRELLVGLHRDGQFGPCVVFGLGGVYTEVLKDTTFRVAPLDRAEALGMIGGIRAHNIVRAFRGMAAADVDVLADILVSIGAIGLDHPNIKEIDINPVILSGARPVAVDALIVLEGPSS